MIRLVPIDDVRASDYNPRKNDEKRLAITELSLRKLGFVLPVHAEKDGEILSGHQRHLVAKRMGFKKIPVHYEADMPLDKRKGINIIYNRATNDQQKQDTPLALKKKLYSMDLQSIAKGIPDVDIESEDAFPCVYSCKRMDTQTLAKKNVDRFDRYMATMAGSLYKMTRQIMPIVVTEDGTVINGIGRLQFAAERKIRFVHCVIIDNKKAELAKIMLNMLSMDFSIDSNYADFLRCNAFMRERNTRERDAEGNYALGRGFFKGIFPKNNGRDFMELKGKSLEKWRAKYGENIVDFGAGKLNNTRTLRKAGLNVSAFEPYFVSAGDVIHKEKSLEIDRKFLEDVASGIPFDSVFISSVFNSVPFIEDRKKIAIIAAALCNPNGRVVCWCQSYKANQFVITKKKNAGDGESKSTFELGYEPNTVIGDLSVHPKVQKGHTSQELVEIFSPCFDKINRIDMISRFWYLEATNPKNRHRSPCGCYRVRVQSAISRRFAHGASRGSAASF